MPGGGESSQQSSQQSQGYGSSYDQSASVSMPYNMNPTTGNLANTEGLLSNIYSMLQGGSTNNSLLQSFLAPYGGALSAPVTAAQNTTLGNIASAQSGNYSFDPDLQSILGQLVNEATNPTGFGQSIAAGGTGANSAVGAGQLLAGGAFNGATSAANAGTYLASNLFGGAPNATAAGQNTAATLFGGAQNAQAAGTSLASALYGGAPNATAASQQYANALFGNGVTNATQAGQAYASGLAGPGSPTVGEAQFAENLANNPETNAIIAEAEQPITTAFNTQTVPGLQGSIAQAGQRATGGGSSAFGAAFGNAQAQEEAQLGSVAANIANSAYQTGLGQYATAYGQGSNLYSNAYNNAGNNYANTFNTGATEYGGAFNNAVDQFANSYNMGAQQYAGLYGQGAQNYENLYGVGVNGALNAPNTYASLTSNDISNMISELSAQALPQMTEQLGINNALSTYNNSVNSILQALGLQVQGEQPVIGYGSESVNNSASFQNEESSGQASGSSFNFSLPGLL